MRNFFAHAIDDVDNVGDMILYKDIKNDNLRAIDLKKLSDDLLKFGDKIKDIVNNSDDFDLY